MTKALEIMEKIKRKINKFLTSSKLYERYFSNDVVWENAVLLESFSGQNFQGNPYYIFKELLFNSEYKNYHFYIPVIDQDEWKKKLQSRGLYQNNVHIVTYGSVKYVQALCHSKYLVNNVGFNAFFIKKDAQIYLNTWHGTGPKCCGNKLEAAPRALITPQRNFMIADYLLCPNYHTERLILDDHMLGILCKDKMRYSGYPRNTPFSDYALQKKVRKENGFGNKKIVFYLPTWRGVERIADDVKSVSEIDRIAGMLLDTHIVFCKLHPNMMQVSIPMQNCRAIPDQYELYELMCCADYLITDWSSVYTDFAIKSSNIILFQYDRDYMLNDRGLYKDFVGNTPFLVARTGEEVFVALNRDQNCAGYKDFIKLYCPYDGTGSTQAAIDVLFGAKSTLLYKTISIIYIDKRWDERTISDIREQISEDNYMFVLSNTFSDQDYLYYNNMSGMRYLLIQKEETVDIHKLRQNSGANMNDKTFHKKAITEIRKMWGNISIDKVYYYQSDRIPTVLAYGANQIISI